MKILKQFGIILIFSFIGEVLHFLIPLPVPASIYGIILLFLALETKVLKVSDIEETSKFLVSIMPVMFIPAAVGLMDSWTVVKDAWVKYVIVTVATTFLVMIAAGWITQLIIRHTGGTTNE